MERVPRHAYGLSVVPLYLASAIVCGVGALTGALGAFAAGAALLALGLLTSFWMGIGRLHDLGRPAWHSLGLLVPGYNVYLLLLLCARRGQPGRNAYGLDPTAT